MVTEVNRDLVIEERKEFLYVVFPSYENVVRSNELIDQINDYCEKVNCIKILLDYRKVITRPEAFHTYEICKHLVKRFPGKCVKIALWGTPDFTIDDNLFEDCTVNRGMDFKVFIGTEKDEIEKWLESTEDVS